MITARIADRVTIKLPMWFPIRVFNAMVTTLRINVEIIKVRY